MKLNDIVKEKTTGRLYTVVDDDPSNTADGKRVYVGESNDDTCEISFFFANEIELVESFPD